MSAAPSIRDRIVDVRRVRAGDLLPHPMNPRGHPDAQRRAVSGSLASFGQVAPLIAFTDADGALRLVDGHLRASLHPDAEVKVAVTDLSPEEARAVLAVLDPSAALAEVDAELLASLQAMVALDVEAGLLSVSEDLDALLASVTAPVVLQGDPDEIPQAGAARCKSGEVWECADQRILCGDCRDPESWALLLNGERANLVFTSPPYASQRKYDEESGFKPIPPAEYVDWWEPVQGAAARFLAGDGSLFVNIKEHCEDGQRSLYVKDLTLAHVRRWGWRFVEEYCWRRKPFPGDMGPRLKNAWEPVFHFSRDTPKFRPDAVCVDGVTVEYEANNGLSLGGGYRGTHPGHELVRGKVRPSNVVDCSVEGDNPGHGARFPVALPDFFVRAFTDEGDTVLDPFLGSGTTLIAAAQNKRKGRGIELSAKYVDLALARLELATGQEAHRNP